MPKERTPVEKAQDEVKDQSQPETDDQSEDTNQDLSNDDLAKAISFGDDDQDGQEGPEKDEKVSEDQTEKTEASAEDTEAESGESSVEDDEASPPLDDRLKSLDDQYKTEDTPSLRDQIRQAEESLKQRRESFNKDHPYFKLPDLQAYASNGKTPYQMSDTELNALVSNLHDTSRSHEANAISKAVSEFRDHFSDAVSKHEGFEQEAEQIQNAYQQAEWQEVQDEFSKAIPELTPDHIGKVVEYINKNRVDPAFNASIQTLKGKGERVYEALQKTGILEEIRKAQTSAKIDKPAAPDASAGSKRVKTSTKSAGELSDKLERAAKMSQDEFNALPEKERVALIEGNLVF